MQEQDFAIFYLTLCNQPIKNGMRKLDFSIALRSVTTALFLFLLAIVLPSGSLLAQTPFERGFSDDPERDNAYGIDNAGNNYVVTGTVDSPGDANDILLYNVDLNGTSSNAVRIGDPAAPNEEWGLDVIAEPQGAYVVAGAHRGSNQQIKPLLVQTTTTGTIQWASEYPDGNLDGAFNAVAPVSNYGYHAAGYTGNLLSSGANSDLYIAIVSNNTGSQFCGNSFGGNGDDVAYGAAALSNGAFVSVGYTESFGVNGKAAYIVVTDSNCNKVWSRTVDGPGDDIAYAVTEDAFGITIVGQSNSFNSNSRWNTMMIRFNLGGLYLATNIFENPNYQDGARSIKTHSNGGYIISGQTLVQDSIAWMMRLNPNFGVDWYHQFSGISLRDVEDVGTGTFLGAGSIRPTGSTRNDAFVVHADNMGMTGATCNPLSLTPSNTVVTPQDASPPDTVLTVTGSGTSTLSLTSTPIILDEYDACTFVGIAPGLPGRVDLFPNPSAGQVRVDFAFDGMRDTHLELYDLQGRNLLSRELGQTDQGILPLDLSALPAGTYLLRIRADRDVWTRKLIVE
jgi:hypothetical protein